jgi:hypothetical protein
MPATADEVLTVAEFAAILKVNHPDPPELD